ncbi:MAG: hypothetical protein M0Q26_13475 [Chitinophagaceae bacterium]|nr:hypothetical protein [Chitinophagaceae bacterium]
MKTNIGIITLITLASLVVLFIVRLPHYKIGGNIVESVLIDKTDTLPIAPTLEEILLPIHLEENKWNHIRLRTQSISDFDYNHISDLELPTRITIISNPIERDKEIKSFTLKIDSAITNISKQPSGRPKSSIYRSVMLEANRIGSMDAKIKALIVYSDLFENSSIFSIYDTASRTKLKSNPNEIKNRFMQAIKPGNLQNVKVYFVFKPYSSLTNEYFMLTSTLFKSILEDAGATVYIGANLIEN